MQNFYTHNHMIQNAIFDNDGTLYPEPPDVKERHMSAAISTIQPLYPDKSRDEVAALIKKSQDEYKSSFGMFVADLEDEDERSYSLAMLRLQHYRELIKLAEDNFFDLDASPNQEMGELKASGLNLYIATHGNMAWTKFSVKENGGLSRYFNDSNIFTKDQAWMVGKNEGPAFYEQFLDHMDIEKGTDQLRGRNCAMVEDSVKNLIEAKNMGMMTILISQDVTDETKPDYVDVVVKDAKEAIKAIQSSNIARALQLQTTANNFETSLKTQIMPPIPKDLVRKYGEACENKDTESQVKLFGKIMEETREAIALHYKESSGQAASPIGNHIQVKS